MFQIDLMSRQPIYEQLTDQIEKLLLAGILKANDKLPSVRNLSCTLMVNPNTIQKAYSDLCTKGILCSVPGRGCFVSENAGAILYQMSKKKFSDLGDMLNELKFAGVTKAEILNEVEKIFEEGEINQND